MQLGLSHLCKTNTPFGIGPFAIIQAARCARRSLILNLRQARMTPYPFLSFHPLYGKHLPRVAFSPLFTKNIPFPKEQITILVVADEHRAHVNGCAECN